MEIKITEPVLSGLTESPRRLSEMLAGESEILGLSFAGQTAAGIVKEYLSVSHAVFSGCTLGGNCFRDTQLSDVLFENCDLSNLEFSGGMVRVRFSGCRMTGMSLGGVKLMQVSVSRCGGRYMAFSFVRSRRLLFTECDLQESLFNDCRFEQLGFERCNLRESVFHRTPLPGVDLRSCDTTGLGAGPGDLKGAVVTSLQAIEFSRILGVIVEDGLLP